MTPSGLLNILIVRLFDSVDIRIKHAFTALIVLTLISWAKQRFINREFYQIPSIEVGGPFSTLRSKIKFVKHGKDMLQEGYLKYKPRPFRIPDFQGPHVALTGEDMIDELRKYPEELLSFRAASDDIIAGDYTISRTALRNPYHVPIIRNQLTSNLGNLFPVMRDEMLLAFEELIPLTEDWSSVKLYPAIRTMVCRMSNRLFLGVPYCRDPEFVKMNLEFVFNAVVAAQIMNFFPDFLKPLVVRLLTRVPASMKIALKFIRQALEDRERRTEEYTIGQPNKPVDMLTWMLDDPNPEEKTPENLTHRMVILNFASIHGTAIIFTLALIDIATRPEYIQPFREEIEVAIKNHGWTKDAVDVMEKLDSFIKESQRFNSAGALSLFRKAMKDIRLSDGTFIPKGTTISAIMKARQCDEKLYPNATTFDGFRFSNMPSNEAKRSMTAVSLDYLPFGHGRHACPGRFFAAVEMKLILAHILINYDIQVFDPTRPSAIWYGNSCLPNSDYELQFRKRTLSYSF
ncbi:hypothetical protein M422DRAFT_245171 [Sphaerobolus stellatus SS14]|nr:hypothetical protein M422DRAFT_245171 [Sphaerobolus stellatus SS14]